MKRQVGLRTKWALKKLLEKAFLRELKKQDRFFTHNFSREKPYFEVTLRVNADEFAAEVMEAEISVLQKKLKSAQDKVLRLEQERYDPAPNLKGMDQTLPEVLGAMTEKLWEFGEHVIAHQQKTEDGKRYHRLVYCTLQLPQPTSEWVQLPEIVSIEAEGNHFTATEKIVEQVDMGDDE